MPKILRIEALNANEDEKVKIASVKSCHGYDEKVKCFAQYDANGDRAILVFTDDIAAICLLEELRRRSISWTTYKALASDEETIAFSCEFGLSPSDLQSSTRLNLTKTKTKNGTLFYL